MYQATAAKRFDGIEASARVTYWQDVVQQKQALVDYLRQAKYADLLPRHDTVAYNEVKASFITTCSLDVG